MIHGLMGLNYYCVQAMQCSHPARQETEASSHVVEGLPSHHPAGRKEGLDWMAPQLLARPLGFYGKAG